MLAVGKNRYTSAQASFTRLANTTAYAAGDAVTDDATNGSIMTFSGVASSKGGGGRITGAVLHKSDQDLTNAAFTLFLFTESPVDTGFEDNAAIAITDAEWKTCVGFVEFAQADGVSVVTGDIWQTASAGGIPFTCAAADDDLYGVLVAQAAYTPGSGEIFTITLTSDRG